MTEITLPTFHPDQIKAFNLPGRHKVLRNGRRWGKTAFCATWIADGAMKGLRCGWFTPDYRILSDAWNEIVDMLAPVILSSSKNDKMIRVLGGGLIEFWTLENPRAGRSRKYHRIVLDEIAFAKDDVQHIWETAISPTLLDYKGRAIAASTPNGMNPENFFYKLCTEPKWGFVEYHAPSANNPYLPAEELASLKERYHPLVFQQEFDAEFVDWSGEAFFSQDSFLLDGVPIVMPTAVNYVFATIDTTMKGGYGNDGTAVSYWATQNVTNYPGQSPLMLIDWDLVEHEGSMLEVWMPQVFARLNELAVITKARVGVLGSFVEDKAIGTVLLQQAPRKGWPMHPIDSKLTALGKDARAINASGPVYQGKVKIAKPAFEKTLTFRGTTRNHWVSQVVSYRPGDKEADRRQDDLTDTFTYGVAMALGSPEGF